jgi:hypothetical protein
MVPRGGAPHALLVASPKIRQLLADGSHRWSHDTTVDTEPEVPPSIPETAVA